MPAPRHESELRASPPPPTPWLVALDTVPPPPRPQTSAQALFLTHERRRTGAHPPQTRPPHPTPVTGGWQAADGPPHSPLSDAPWRPVAGGSGPPPSQGIYPPTGGVFDPVRAGGGCTIAARARARQTGGGRVRAFGRVWAPAGRPRQEGASHGPENAVEAANRLVDAPRGSPVPATRKITPTFKSTAPGDCDWKR